MKAEDAEKLKLLDQLIAMTRIACKRGKPATVSFAAGILEVLEPKREELLSQQELDLPAGVKVKVAA